MTARKTLPVRPLVRSIQTAIDHAPTVEERKALCFVIERVLFDANAYAGFRDNGHGTRNGSDDDYRRTYYTSKLR